MQNVAVFPTVIWSADPGCHGGCRQKSYIQDGKLVKVEGDEDHPFKQGALVVKKNGYTQDRLWSGSHLKKMRLEILPDLSAIDYGCK